MCYRISTPAKKVLQGLLGDDFIVNEYDFYYHSLGQQHKALPTLTVGDSKAVTPLQWGLKPAPGFTPKPADYKEAAKFEGQTLNTQAEYAFGKPPFEAVKQQAPCLIFANGFYEFRHEETKGKTTTPYFIYMPNQQPFAMGGVQWTWVTPDGTMRQTVSILTTKANTLLSHIHNSKLRMPVIMDNDNWQEWLAPGTSVNRLREMAKTYPDDKGLQAHVISKDVTKRGYDPNVPEIQLPFIAGCDTPKGLFD